MAARENQGLLIAVIILVLLTLVLALAAFLGLSKAGENSDSKIQFEADVAYYKKLSEGYQNQAEILKALAGDFGPDVASAQGLLDSINRLPSGFQGSQQTTLQSIADEAKTILEAYKKDVAGTATDGGEASWRQLIRDLNSVVGKKNSEYNIQVKNSQRATLDAETKIAAAEKANAELQKTLDIRIEELETEKKRSIEKEQELADELELAGDKYEEKNKEFQAFRQVADENIQAAKNLQNEFAAENTSLKSRINELTREDFDRADGEIINVSAGLRTVYINRGSADGLTNNQTFAIYDQEITNFEKHRHKAKVEVTKVFSRSCEARITDENPNSPILSGDHVLSATWDPGYSVPIALAGVFDLDGDIYDDTEKLIQMVKRNGGQVVAWHDSDGVVQGKIDSSIRYLVVGDAPVADGNTRRPKDARNIVVAMQQMQDDAQANTVELIDLQKLLNRMGVRARPKTVLYEQRSGEFRPRSPSDGSGSRNDGSGSRNEGSGSRNEGSGSRNEGSGTR